MGYRAHRSRLRCALQVEREPAAQSSGLLWILQVHLRVATRSVTPSATSTPKPDWSTPKPDWNTPKPDCSTPKPDWNTPKPDWDVWIPTPNFGCRHPDKWSHKHGYLDTSQGFDKTLFFFGIVPMCSGFLPDTGFVCFCWVLTFLLPISRIIAVITRALEEGTKSASTFFPYI